MKAATAASSCDSSNLSWGRSALVGGRRKSLDDGEGEPWSSTR